MWYAMIASVLILAVNLNTLVQYEELSYDPPIQSLHNVPKFLCTHFFFYGIASEY